MTSSPSAHRLPPRTDEISRVPVAGQHVVRPLAAAYCRSRWDVRVHDRHRLPRRGPVLLAANHLGWLDGPLVVATAVRPVHALVKTELFAGRTGRVLRLSGQLSVERAEVDVGAVRRSLRVLRDGRALLVFPEGRRGNGEVAETRRGLAYLALVTGAPVVPVAVLGTRGPGASIHSTPDPGTRLLVAYGPPVEVEAQPFPRRRTTVGALAERLRETLAGHVAAAGAASGIGLPGPAPDEAEEDRALAALPPGVPHE